jgi:hypothetical protein
MSIQELARVRFRGVLDDKNISAVAFWRERALMVTDEVTSKGNVMQMFTGADDEFRAAAQGLVRLDAEPSAKKPKEMDLEGIAVDGDTVFVIGSHSAKRKKVDADAGFIDNRKALTGVPTAEPARDVLLRVSLDAEGHAESIERTSLRAFLDTTEPFRSFHAIASKENGPDIEGLAVRDDQLFVGFRGPLLRGNFTPILRCRFGSPIKEPTVLFVNLGGRGVRDLAEVDDGLLILAGPVGDGPGSYQVYWWDGRDGVPGTGAPTSPDDPGSRLIGDLPPLAGDAGAPGAPPKAEGLALVAEDDQHWDVLIVFDGLADGQAVRYRISRP